MALFLYVSAYRFVSLSAENLLSLKKTLLEATNNPCIDLRGTILLSKEGINLMLSGSPSSIESIQCLLEGISSFQGLTYKKNYSDKHSFKRIKVKIKAEIIPFANSALLPALKAPYISPQTFKEWYVSGKKMIVLDTRNHYEVEAGTFQDAVDLNLHHFRDFPFALTRALGLDPHLPIVTFCTGGIRCEKAASYMLNAGFREVHQLEGGILGYFDACGGDYYKGNCFVFDERQTISPT